MTVIPKALIVAALAASTLTACSTNRYGERNLNSTGRGAAIGAVGGAVVGALAGDVVAGAAIGAAGGAVVGAVADDDNRYEDRDGRRYYYDRRDRERRYYYNDRRERIYDPR